MGLGRILRGQTIFARKQEQHADEGSKGDSTAYTVEDEQNFVEFTAPEITAGSSGDDIEIALKLPSFTIDKSDMQQDLVEDTPHEEPAQSPKDAAKERTNVSPKAAAPKVPKTTQPVSSAEKRIQPQSSKPRKTRYTPEEKQILFHRQLLRVSKRHVSKTSTEILDDTSIVATEVGTVSSVPPPETFREFLVGFVEGSACRCGPPALTNDAVQDPKTPPVVTEVKVYPKLKENSSSPGKENLAGKTVDVPNRIANKEENLQVGEAHVGAAGFFTGFFPRLRPEDEIDASTLSTSGSLRAMEKTF